MVSGTDGHAPGDFNKEEIGWFCQRLDDLKKAYLDFKSAKVHMHPEHEWPFRLNDTKAETVCAFFINDIKKFKRTHGSTGTDNLKRSAYLARWIAKIRPIEFDYGWDNGLPSPRTQKDFKNPGLDFLNEEFAIRIFFSYLNPCSVETLRSPVCREVARQLKYIFCQREIPRELLVTVAYATQAALGVPNSEVKPL
jgi:hypothetical protein